MREIGCPECDGTVLVSKVNNGIVRILTHGVACSELGSVLHNKLTSRSVLVFEITGIALRGDEWTE